MIDPIERIAEARIQEAIERGEFSNLPGAGRPLQLQDDSLVPKDLRAGYRILKNAGFLPPEVQVRKDIAEAEQLLLQIRDPGERARAQARLQLLRVRLESSRGRRAGVRIEASYQEKILERLEDSHRS